MTSLYHDVANRIAFTVIAKKRPDDLFKAVFFDINEEAQKYITQKSQEALSSVKATLEQDLAKRGYSGQVVMKLGSFRGHPYFTTAKISLKAKNPFGENDPRLGDLLSYLKGKYSPKFNLKGVSKDGTATFNIR